MQVATPELWEKAKFIGIQQAVSDDDVDHELRNCECGSTMSKPLVKKNPPPRGARYWPSVAVDPDDIDDDGMTFLNALRSLIEYIEQNATGDLDITMGTRPRETTQRIVAHLRNHQEWDGRWVLEILDPDGVPDTVWNLAHTRRARWMQNLVAVVPVDVPAPGELSAEQTRERISRQVAALGGDPEVDRGWAVFDTGRDLEIEIDDEFWSGAPDAMRVADTDVAQLPEAQAELRAARMRTEDGEDMDAYGPVVLPVPQVPGEDFRVVLLDSESGVGQDGDVPSDYDTAIDMAIGMARAHHAPVIVWTYIGNRDDGQKFTVFSVAPRGETVWMEEYESGGTAEQLEERRILQRHLRLQGMSSRIQRGDDMADEIDRGVAQRQQELRRQARAAVATALDIDHDNEELLNAIVDRLNFTVTARMPAVGEIAWEVPDGADLDDARDEIWRESDELGWVAQPHMLGAPTPGMHYVVISPDTPGAIGAGNLAYVVNKWISDPDKFTAFARAAQSRLRMVAPSDTDEEGAKRMLRYALMFGDSMPYPEQRRLADQMLDRVADELHRMWHTGSNKWATVIITREHGDERDFMREVHQIAQRLGYRGVDATGAPYSLQRPPMWWTGTPTTMSPGEVMRHPKVPIFFRHDARPNDLELAITRALDIDYVDDDWAVTEDSYLRPFVAAVWEEVLRRRTAGTIPFVYSRVDEIRRFNVQIFEAAQAIARIAPYGREYRLPAWHWQGHIFDLLPEHRRDLTAAAARLAIQQDTGPVAGAVGMPPDEEIPPEARGIATAMATPRVQEWFQPQAAIAAVILNSDEALIRRIWERMIAFSPPDAWQRMHQSDRYGFSRAVLGVQASLADEDERTQRSTRTSSSGSERVPGLAGRTEAPMEMTRTSGGLGEYPTAIRAHVQNFRDTSYRNDMYDSVEFSVGPNVYRLWVAPEDRASRENEEDPRYAVMTVDPPHAGATLDEIFEGGQPSGDTIFESESPHDLFRFIREFAVASATVSDPERAIMAATRAVPHQQPRDTSGMAAPYLEAYLDVLDAMDLADDIGGPDDNDYIELMNGIAEFARSREERPMFTAPIDQSLLTSEIFEHARRAINRMWDTALARDEETSENYRQPLRRIRAEARRRAEVVGRVLGGEREAEVRRELGMPLRPPISPSQVRPAPPPMPPRQDMSEVRGLNEAVAIAEQAVAGRQNLLLIGPPGVGKTMIARRIPTIFPPNGDVVLRAPHHTISQRALASDDPRSEVQLARGGVLFLDQLNEFQPSAIEALGAELRRIPAAERPLVVASVDSLPLPRRIAQALDFPLRAEVRALQLADMRYAPQAESSATIRARIAAGPPAPIDYTVERFRQLEIGRAAPLSPMERSIRLARELQVGTRVHVVSAIIRPPELYIPRGAAGEVTTKDARGGEHAPTTWRIEVTMDDGTKVWWANQNLEHLATELEVEPESAERYRLIELNPSKRNMKHNPEWVTKLLSKHFEFLEDKVEAKWLPRLSDVGAKGGKVFAALKEYGCGAYGCVLPTLDPKVVLKVTTDDTEAQFAEQLSENLPSQVTVSYHLVARLPEKHAGRDVWLLWRDSAEDVGKIDEVVAKAGRNKKAAEAAINAQHRAAQLAFVAMIKGDDPDGAADMAKRMAQAKRITPREAKDVLVEDYNKYLDAWEAAAVEMGDKVPELRELARGMVEDLRSEGVLFGDIHADNIGRVGKRWLIIDPGHVSVMQLS